MKRISSIIFFLGIFSCAYAQQIPFRNSLKVNIDRVGLDSPDAISTRYSVQYNRLFGGSRLKFGAKAGYLKTEHSSILPTVLNRRMRQTLDLTLSYDLLRSQVHHIYPGFGFSAWRRDDTIVRQAEFTRNPDGSVDIKSMTTSGAQEVNIGPYFSLEYELRFQPRFSLSAQIGLNNLNNAGWNSNAGLSFGYHF